MCCICISGKCYFAEQSTGEEIAAFALQYEGYPYVYGGSSPSGFDCSGFVQYVYNRSGYEISRVCTSQYFDGEHISLLELEAGDIVLFANTYINGISHAGIYIGDNQFIHAATSHSGVIITSLSDNYYASRFATGVRVANLVAAEQTDIEWVTKQPAGAIFAPKKGGAARSNSQIIRLTQ